MNKQRSTLMVALLGVVALAILGFVAVRTEDARIWGFVIGLAAIWTFFSIVVWRGSSA